MGKKKIVILDKVWLSNQDTKELEQAGDLSTYDSMPTFEEAVERATNAHIIVTKRFPITKEFLDKCPWIELIVIASSGIEKVDIKAAEERKIVVTNCPGYATEAVAEHTIALFLTVGRKLFSAHQTIFEGSWRSSDFVGFELQGKILGVIGFGRIGRRVAEIARSGFQMEILSYDIGNTREELEDLLRRSDFISINLPATDETNNLLTATELAWMKRTAILVNTGRGTVIDESALVKALENGTIAGVGLDVLTVEPMSSDNLLSKLSNVFITPHIGAYSDTALKNLSHLIASNIYHFLANQPMNVITSDQKF